MINNGLMIDGDFNILHEGNHNERGNPHPQYILTKSSSLQSSQIENTQDKFLKLCTATAPTNYTNLFNFKFLLSVYGNGISLNSGIIDIVLRFDGNTTCKILISGNLSSDMIYGVINGTTLDIYIKLPSSWECTFIKPLDSSCIKIPLAPIGNVVYSNDSANLLTNLPSGTQVPANYILSNSSLQENGYKKFGDGLIVQWGEVDGILTSGKTNGTIYFPISFNTTCVYIKSSIVDIDENTSLLDNVIVSNYWITAQTVLYRINQTQGVGSTFKLKFLAIGY